MLKYLIRNYSQLQVTSKPQSWLLMKSSDKNQDQLNNDILKDHKNLYQHYASDCLLPFTKEKEFQDSLKRFEELCYYYDLNREFYPSMIIINWYKTFEKKGDIKLASMLAWAFEAVSTCTILSDDFMDNQKMRWKRPTWYRKPYVGVTVISDCYLMRTTAFNVLKKYFSNHLSFPEFFHLLAGVDNAIAVAQNLDLTFTKFIKQRKNFELLTMKKYETAARYKAYLPVIEKPILAAMYLTGHDHFQKCEHILQKFGPHIQIANDVCDCFGKFETTGKEANDIPEGKFTWALAKALECANQEQKLLLETNYGKPKIKCQNVVMDVYKEINLVQKFHEHKEKLLEDIRNDVKKPELRSFMQTHVNGAIDVDDDVCL